MDFFETIRKRHSVREFLPKGVENEKIEKILEAANHAPSAGNNQGYEIVVLEEPLRIVELLKSLVDQKFEKPAPVVLVFCANEKRSEVTFGARGKSLYGIQDASFAGAYAQLAAAGLGLASVWVGAFRDEDIRKIIAAPDHIRPVGLLSIGYPAVDPTSTPRRQLTELVHRDKY
jgi:nitroreductase